MSDVRCPEGYHIRKAYKTKAGKEIIAQCIKKITKTEKPVSIKPKKKTVKVAKYKKLIPTMRSLGKKPCPPGMVRRKSYDRKYSNTILKRGFTKKGKNGKIIVIHPKNHEIKHIEPECVKEVVLPGKDQKLIGPLKEGELSKYGYTMKESEDIRRTALRKAIQEYGALNVYRKLDAVSKLTLRTIPEASKIYTKDKEWVKTTYGPLKEKS